MSFQPLITEKKKKRKICQRLKKSSFTSFNSFELISKERLKKER